MRLALFEPDIPQNAGALLRLGASLGVPVDIIAPCGFPLSDKSLRRAGMDYIDLADYRLHPGWADFRAAHSARLVLLTTRADLHFTDFGFQPDDILMVGRESAGVPDFVHAAADARVKIPLRPVARSINVANAAAMVLGEALRQTKGFPT